MSALLGMIDSLQGNMPLSQEERDSIDVAYDVLMPDAETGLMPCGCGDIPSLRLEEDYYIVSCKTCGEASDYCYSKSHAINQWNNLVRQSVEKAKA